MSVQFRKAPIVIAVALAAASQFTQAQLQLEEVIVTAQKRAESLQDVPISVSAIQGTKIADAGIQNMSALADYVPNLYISEAPVSTNIYMRGMGSGNNQAFEQSVGMYIDGVYMGRGRQYRAPFLDIERVEVLRGPQGTLFGKNTVAGAVNITTASPNLDDPLNGNISLSAETNGGYIGEGMLSGALSDTFAARVAFKYRETDGFVENTFLDTDEPETEETFIRLSALWQVTDNLDATFKYSYSEYDRIGVASGTNLYIDQAERDANQSNRSAFADIAYLITDINYPNFGAQASREFEIFKDNGLGPGLVPNPTGNKVPIGINPESSENENNNFVLSLNYYLGEYTITSITGYSSYTYVDGTDVDWLPLQFISRDDDQEFDQFSQEIRIASPTGGFFEYIAGGYYEQSDLEFDRRVVIDTNMGGLVEPILGVPNLVTLLTGGAYTADQIVRDHNYQLDSDSWAVFGQGTFNISDTLRLTLGIRYTKETKDVTSTQFLSDSLTGVGTPSEDFFLRFIFATNFNTYIYDYEKNRETDDLIPSVNLQWDATDNSMFYFSFSEGFKSGGFSGADDGEPGGLIINEFAPYDPTVPGEDFEFEDEEVTAFEIGGKHTLLDGAMTANWAVFYTEYDNLQTSIFKGVGFGVTNAAQTTVQGVEFDMLWQATEGLRLGLNAAYLDAEYDTYKDAPCNAIQVDASRGFPGGPAVCGQNIPSNVDPDGNLIINNDLSGETTTYAPEYSASLFFEYSYLMSGGMEFFAGGEANYRDEFSTQGDNDELDFTDSYTKINLRFGLRGANEDWEVMVYGRNITDEQVYIYGFDVPILTGSHAAVIDEGEVYGARFRYTF